MNAYTFGQKLAAETPAWQRSEGKNDEGGLNEAGRKSYEREHGGDLKAPVTESNPSGERAKRQNSFCARMCGMKRVNTGSKTKSDPDSRINKSLRKWNCKCSSAAQFGVKLAGLAAALARGVAKQTERQDYQTRQENFEHAGEPGYEPTPEMGDSAGLLLALALGGGALGLTHGPKMYRYLTGSQPKKPSPRKKLAEATAAVGADEIQPDAAALLALALAGGGLGVQRGLHKKFQRGPEPVLVHSHVRYKNKQPSPYRYR